MLLRRAGLTALAGLSCSKDIPEVIIFVTHNLQTFKRNTLVNKLLLMQFYIFNICLKLHHRK